MKRIQIILSVAVLLITLSGCGNPKVQSNDSNKNTATTTDNQENTTNDTKDNNVATQKDSASTNSNKKNSTNTNSNKTEKSTNSNTNSQVNADDSSSKEKVIDYIINGQGNKSEAEKMKWSEAFLYKVDIDALSNQYIANGGITNNLENFAKYITLNAPIPTDWETLFKNDFYKRFGEKVVRLSYLEGDLYQAYVNHDGIEIPYVVVSSRTGYFHG